MGRVWEKGSIETCFEEFFSSFVLKAFCVIPILVSWGLWLDKNANLFEDKFWPSFKVVQWFIALFNHYKLKPKV
jgi:hypothetical protein